MYDYNRNLKWSKLRVGIMVSAALIIIFLTVMFASNLGALFASEATIYADFTDVRGLKAGAPVWLSGVEIGKVTGIYFRKTGAVRVAVSIKKDYLRFINRDSRASVTTLGLLGDKYLVLSPGTERSGALQPGEVVTGTVPPDLQEIAGTGSAALAKLGLLVERLDHLTYLIESGEGSAAKFINDPALYDNLKESSKKLSAILNSVERGRGTLGRLVGDDTLYADLEAAAGNLRKFVVSLQDPAGSLNKLIKDRTLYDKLLSASNSLDNFSAKLEKSRGTLGRFIEDKSLYENINTSSRKLSVILDRLEKGEGTLGELTKNGRVSRELEQTISDLKALIEDIKKDPKRYFKFSIF